MTPLQEKQEDHNRDEIQTVPRKLHTLIFNKAVLILIKLNFLKL